MYKIGSTFFIFILCHLNGGALFMCSMFILLCFKHRHLDFDLDKTLFFFTAGR